jgi:hypothetical protein
MADRDDVSTSATTRRAWASTVTIAVVGVALIESSPARRTVHTREHATCRCDADARMRCNGSLQRADARRSLVRIRRERPYDDLVGRLAGLVALALTACRVLDDGHCANADGDATCSARGAGLDHCDRCVARNDGCVAEPPTPECAVDGTDTGSASTSTDGSTTTVADVDSSTTTTSSTETTSDSTTASESSETSESSGASSESTSADESSSTTQGEPPCLAPTSPCEADAECCSETCTGLGLCL